MKDLSVREILIIFYKRLKIKRKRQLMFLFLLVFLTAFFETLSLASAFPFLQLIIDSEKIWNNLFLNNLLNYFGFTKLDDLTMPICLVFASTAIISSSLKIFYLWISNRISAAISSDLSSACFNQNIFYEYSKLIDRNSSDLITNNAVYMNQCTDILISIAKLFSNILIGLSIAIYLILLNPLLAISSILIFIFFYYLLGRIIQKRLVNNSKIIDYNSKKQVQIINEVIGSFRDIIVYSSQNFFIKKYINIDTKIRFKNAENSFLNLMPRYVIEGLFLLIITLLVYIVKVQYSNSIDIIATLGTFALGSQKLLPCMQQGYGTWSYILGAKSSLLNIINLSTKKYNSDFINYKVKPIQFKHSIKLVNVSFKYPGSSSYIFQNLNFEIFKGQKIGIIGKTGTGKSTFLDIILGILDPNEGFLEIDGIKINDFNNPFYKSKWRKTLAYVPQNIFLNDSTIAENIAFGEDFKKIDMQRLEIATRKANIQKFILSQTHKYNSFIGENGVKISGGQRQRIGIARAFYKPKEIFIFDEATSSLDPITESKIMDNFYSVENSNTLLVISHRKSALKRCDKIIEIHNKNIRIINE